MNSPPVLIDFAKSGAGGLGEVDVAIIGSGAAGIAMADELISLGCRVMVIEAGGFAFKPGEQTPFFASASHGDHPPGDMYRRRTVGGTTTVWGGRCIPFDQSDFDATDKGDGASWPISYDEVAPYLERANRWLLAGEPVFNAAEALPDEPAQMIACTSETVSFGEIERFSLPMHSWRERGRAILDGPNSHLLSRCSAVEILPDGDGGPVSLRVRSSGGAEAILPFPVVVLACGGLENARLLLASRSSQTTGLGNAHDNVGRYFMSHVIADAGQLVVTDPAGVRLGYSRDAEGVYVRRLLKVAKQARRENGLLNCIARPDIPNIADASHRNAVLSLAFFAKRFIIAEYRQRLVREGKGGSGSLSGHVRNIAAGLATVPGFAIDWTRRRILAKRKLPSLFLVSREGRYPLQVIGEQAPLRNSRVTLSSRVDPHGVPLIEIDWRYCDDDVRSLRQSVRLMAEALRDGDVARIELSDADLEGIGHLGPQAGHHIGTTRMSADPRHGVTDGWGRVWSTQRVFVAGSSLFPRSGVANPTLMIVALALRNAQEIAREALAVRSLSRR